MTAGDSQLHVPMGANKTASSLAAIRHQIDEGFEVEVVMAMGAKEDVIEEEAYQGGVGRDHRRHRKHQKDQRDGVLWGHEHLVEERTERMVVFADAVIAIALTLLILPLMENASEGEQDSVGKWYEEYKTQLGAFIVSFLVVNRFWKAHNDVFLIVKKATKGMTILHMVWLLSVVFMPVAVSITFNTTNRTTALEGDGEVEGNGEEGTGEEGTGEDGTGEEGTGEEGIEEGHISFGGSIQKGQYLSYCLSILISRIWWMLVVTSCLVAPHTWRKDIAMETSYWIITELLLEAICDTIYLGIASGLALIDGVGLYSLFFLLLSPPTSKYGMKLLMHYHEGDEKYKEGISASHHG